MHHKSSTGIIFLSRCICSKFYLRWKCWCTISMFLRGFTKLPIAHHIKQARSSRTPGLNQFRASSTIMRTGSISITNARTGTSASVSVSTSSSNRALSTTGRCADASGDSGAMKDEYGVMDDSGETFSLDHFTLESGETLKDVQVRYRAFGRLNDARDNVIVVCHALTGNAQLDQWWGTMLGPGKVMDTDKYLVVCANVLGGCYGTTGPQSINPDTGRPYGMDFQT